MMKGFRVATGMMIWLRREVHNQFLTALGKILGLCTRELLQTPSELGDTVSQSQQPLIFNQNIVSQPNVITLGF